jgi:xanthine/uracil/vitamin C permease (AzgA family)
VSRLRLVCVALAAATLLAACGSSAGLIPQTSANTLHTDLTNIDNDYYGHDCASARADLYNAETDFSDLLTGVNPRLARQLQAGLATLTADETSQCHAASSGNGSGNNGSTGTNGSTGPTGVTGTTSTSTSSTTTSSTTTSSTTSSAATTTGGPTGATCVTTTNPDGGTPICVGATSPSSGIGGAGNGVGATNTGAASVGN